MKDKIISLYQQGSNEFTSEDRALFDSFVDALNQGSIRACEPTEAGWITNGWVKQGILLGFRMGKLAAMPLSSNKEFYEKDTMPEKRFTLQDQVRIVPGGTSARTGCYIAAGVTIMPPAYINIGAWIGSGSLIDSHALVGSCAQIGSNVHLSAGAMIGGVLEPIGSRPVVIEDNAFVGGNTGIYEGVMVSKAAVIASGTILTASTPVFDLTQNRFLPSDPHGSYTIPEGAVVVPGSRKSKLNPDFHIYCPIIVKYRDAKTDQGLRLEDELRHIFE
ncbi:MAG TPA: 2,3,4,5-tetrahydropyridine-2,6-dicarboxylate N-succinyltransferase [Candidatus Cloacimonadota bacterium]|nr:2,3,4,5-tetrahydropyridine-2,6-dicarboxylate N-succinyltransferase [Candidatus Cloacimonadota bacterium]